MATSPKFKPSTNRGVALAEEVLAVIEAEEEVKNGFSIDNAMISQNVWQQSVWGRTDLDTLPPGTSIEVIPSSIVPTNFWDNDGAYIAIDAGVSCGTAMCFAGHAAALVGDRLVVGVSDAVLISALSRSQKARHNVRRILNAVVKRSGLPIGGIDKDLRASHVITADGRVMRVSDRARELLGLSEGDTDKLFDGSNQLKDLRRYVKRLKEDRYLSNGRKR